MSESHPEEVRYFFIRRPVLAGVISIVITLLGAFAMIRLPINRYPQITPPSVTITAVYPGATSEVVAQAVAAPIEQQLSGLDGLLYYQSANSNAGTSTISVFFDISRNQDIAAVEVQNAVKLAEPQLPEEVRRNGIVIQKANSNILLVVALTSDDPRYDAAYLTNYAKLYVEDELKRLPGVGNAQVFGGFEFSMLLSLDPEKMAQLGITVDDVARAVREQNATNPAGRIGREPAPPGTQLTVPVTTTGRLTTPEEFGAIIVRARPDGSLVRVSDLARVRLGALSYDAVGRLSGRPTTFMLVYARPGANNLDARDAVVDRMTELQKGFPQGIRWDIPFDTTPFIRASAIEVVKTLVEAMLLVTLVVFLFLESWRATLIPVLAVPVSIIGTFLGLQVLGFTINTLTLFGLVLAIGIVVDDAIVVIENVERIMEEEHLPPRFAADKAIRQVAGALIAIVLSLCAVFVPVAFLSGITGAMYKEFALTIVIAVVISGVVALTLTPALCAGLLRHTAAETTNRFFRWFNAWFDRIRERYLRGAGGVIARPRAGLAAFLVVVGLAAFLYRRVPGAFIPVEDKGFFVVSINLPDAASRQRTDEVVGRIEQMILADSSVVRTVSLVGLDLLTFSNQSNSATMFVGLKPWDERKKKSQSVDAIVQRVGFGLFQMKEAFSFAFNFPEIPGLGRTAGLELNPQARAGQDYRTFAGQVQALVQDVNKLPVVQGAQSQIRADVPQLFVKVDEEAAHARGVGTGQIFSTLQAMLGSLYINDFNLYGRTYRVQAEAQSEFRQRPEDLGRFFVRNDHGDMIPLSSLVTSEMRGGPAVISRFNGFPSALLTANPAPGRSSGEVIQAVEKLIADKYAAQGVGYAYSGQSYQERAAGGGGGLVIALGLIMVFLVLAAQYESWAIPFAVLLGIPFGVLGALLGAWLRGMANDVYFQVGMIAVMGLAAKNAILIVEFANELRAQGKSIRDAALTAARQRLRPILMTSFAFILGVSPLLIASGAGAASRHSIGTGVFAGMLVATLVGIFFIPLFFSVIRGLADRLRSPGGRTAPVPVPASPEAE
ncbi:MAG TPA: multidrug efflux RND transporter permease subunit [Gemmatimonadales bacterium]|nr:multidrug efflux RND transporter permease subunit [Gemmatimonadales bacterium]